MLTKIIINNENYIVIYSPKSKSNFYKPLLYALWDKLTDNQKNKATLNNRKNDKIIIFDRVLLFYKICKGHTLNHNNNKKSNISNLCNINEKCVYRYFSDNDEEGCCACGVKIIYEHIIQNIETKRFYIIGSECIHWWDRPKEINNSNKIIKAILNDKEIPTFCAFCQCNRNCIKCEKKQYISNLFNEWKNISVLNIANLLTNMNMKVRFGKYRGQIYYELCKNDNYTNWVLNNINDLKLKSIIREYTKYKYLLMKPKYQKLFIK
jgi:hypothetical protein